MARLTMVADIITERTDHLRANRDVRTPVLFPDIYPGPLPTVHADPAMMRQPADYSGTGLGLAICQRIIDRHGGTITATRPDGNPPRVRPFTAGIGSKP